MKGFIGLGSQGGPMAERVRAEGFDLAVWARRAEVLQQFTTQGAVAVETPARLGECCDHVGVCVVDDGGVMDICGQLVPAMRPGSLLAIHSTVLPETCETLARRCAERGLLFLDAPVSGGGPAASTGTLTVMCGGTQEAFDRALPVLKAFGRHIVLLGGAGSGQRAKIINNALMAAAMGLSHAALGAAEVLGVDRAALVELIRQSSGRSFAFEVYARLPSPPAFAHGASLLQKDIDILRSILAGHAGAEALNAAADLFLSAAIHTQDQCGS